VPDVLTRKEAQEQTRERVLVAAAKVFARRGYHRATVDEIASEAGFTIGALYSNFAGKEDLFLALADRQVSERVAEVAAMGDAAEGHEPNKDAAEQLRAFLERDPEWPLLFYEFWSLSVRNPELQGELAKRRDAIRDALAETPGATGSSSAFRRRSWRQRSQRRSMASPSSALPIRTPYRTRSSPSSSPRCLAARSQRPALRASRPTGRCS
jgi:AcrR family transcriptional regulator